MGTFRAKRSRRRRARRNGCFRRLLFLKIHLILSVSVFSNYSSLFTIHASKSGSPLFSSTLRAVNRMIRWKRKKAKYPDEKFAKGWKTLAKKLLTLASIVSGSSVSISQFFSSCQLLAQNWILNIALECKVSFREVQGKRCYRQRI